VKKNEKLKYFFNNFKKYKYITNNKRRIFKMNANRMTAADFMMMEFQEEQERTRIELENERIEEFIRGEYEFEEGEILPAVEECDNMDKALDLVFRIENIRSKDDLDEWCGENGRKKLYNIVSIVAPEHYYRSTVKTPDNSIRQLYQTKLVGYKQYKG
jgi:hypothetical protein